MEAYRSSAAACFPVCCAVILLLGSRASAYHNYTVGDALGWYDRLQEPQVNYQKWVAGKNFSLGDFLSEFLLSFPKLIGLSNLSDIVPIS